jgi:RIO kinase 1
MTDYSDSMSSDEESPDIRFTGLQSHDVYLSHKEPVKNTRHILHKLSDKSDHATAEQVLDPKTRMILFKILNSGVVSEVHGCISTGKEANVYHAVTDSGQNFAIKVYKTSILVFKDRQRYVTGEYRFRNGYSKHNPRKMVKVWAEKEMRNLKRYAFLISFRSEER